MPIIPKIGAVLAKKSITIEALGKTANIPLAKLVILKNGDAKSITFHSLNAMCKALSCQPHDLLEYREPEY